MTIAGPVWTPVKSYSSRIIRLPSTALHHISPLQDAISDKADWIQKLEKDREEVQREIDATRDAKEALAEQLAATGEGRTSMAYCLSILICCKL